MAKYVNEFEVARITGLAVQTLRNWRFQGRSFPYSKLGKAIRYNIDDVLKYMEAQKITPEDLK
ncbi:MAG: DNA-binding protein [Thermodesulfobacteriota bacterium]|nr:MAG: DNA-binding protein [Thermodesulfobacteriota bacterium]